MDAKELWQREQETAHRQGRLSPYLVEAGQLGAHPDPQPLPENMNAGGILLAEDADSKKSHQLRERQAQAVEKARKAKPAAERKG